MVMVLLTRAQKGVVAAVFVVAATTAMPGVIRVRVVVGGRCRGVMPAMRVMRVASRLRRAHQTWASAKLQWARSQQDDDERGQWQRGNQPGVLYHAPAPAPLPCASACDAARRRAGLLRDYQRIR